MLENYVWQSRVEIEHYSVAYFACIAVFETLQHVTSIKGGAHMRWVNSSILTTFDFYPGLPHVHVGEINSL